MHLKLPWVRSWTETRRRGRDEVDLLRDHAQQAAREAARKEVDPGEWKELVKRFDRVVAALKEADYDGAVTWRCVDVVIRNVPEDVGRKLIDQGLAEETS